MERSKVRPTDNIRVFVLARFFIEYLLILRNKRRKSMNGHGEENPPDAELLPLGLVAEMAEMESVRWVVMRMKFTMDDRVGLSQ